MLAVVLNIFYSPIIPRRPPEDYALFIFYFFFDTILVVPLNNDAPLSDGAIPNSDYSSDDGPYALATS